MCLDDSSMLRDKIVQVEFAKMRNSHVTYDYTAVIKHLDMRAMGMHKIVYIKREHYFF